MQLVVHPTLCYRLLIARTSLRKPVRLRDQRAPAYIKGADMISEDNQIDEMELARLGMKRIQADIFLWGEYRYTNLLDDVAAAKREEKQ